MQPVSLHPKPLQASAVAGAPPKPPGAAGGPDRLRDMTERFEAVFIRQILNDAQKPQMAKPLFGTAPGDDIIRDLTNEKMADQISRSGDFGLARSLEVSLRKTIPKTAPADIRGAIKS